MSFNESIRAHFIVAGGQVTQKIQEGERANLQFRTTFLNVEHFYDDQFRKRGGAKKETYEKDVSKDHGRLIFSDHSNFGLDLLYALDQSFTFPFMLTVSTIANLRD